VISGFCHEVAENCTILVSSGNLLGFYAASSGTVHCLITQKIVFLVLGITFKYSEKFYIQQPFGPRDAS
jgi:hypothetical protein